MTFESRNLSVRIEKPFSTVYEFLSKPENFPRWASGLGKLSHVSGDEWVTETPQGSMKVRFTKRNEFGILDHYVNPGEGAEIYIPMRLISNGNGSELIFTLIRLQGMTDEKFEEDFNWVERDLVVLKRILEG